MDDGGLTGTGDGGGTTIVLDARGWRSRADFFAALLPALRTPEWAGGNLDALFDCLVAGHLGVPLPVVVQVSGASGVPRDVAAYLARAVRVFDDARRQYAVDARMVVSGASLGEGKAGA